LYSHENCGSFIIFSKKGECMTLLKAKYLLLGNGLVADINGALATHLKDAGGVKILTIEELSDVNSVHYVADEGSRAALVGSMVIGDEALVTKMIADGAVTIQKISFDGDVQLELNEGAPQFTVTGIRTPENASDAVPLGYLDSRLAGLAGDLTQTVEQVAHGFESGDFIFHNGTAWAKAQADSADTAATHVAQVVDVDNFSALSVGEVNVNGLLDDQGVALEAGKYYFLSSTVAGKLSQNIPTAGNLAQLVLKVNAADQSTVFIKQGVIVAEFDATWGNIGGDILDQADLQAQFAETRDSISYLAQHVSQPAHGIVSNSFVFHNGTVWELAQANDEAKAATHFAVVKDADNLKIIQAGEQLVDGLLDDQGDALVEGEFYFLSPTAAGSVSRVAPTTGQVAQVVMKVNSGSFTVIIKQPTLVSAFSAMWGEIGGSIADQADLEAIIANTEAVLGVPRTSTDLGEFGVDHPLNDTDVKQALTLLQSAIDGVEQGSSGDLLALYTKLGLDEAGQLLTAFPAFGDEEAKASFAESIRILLENALHRNGSVAMTGDLDLATNSIVNVADPVNPQDAATKIYVDTKVADEIKALADGLVWQNEVIGVYADAAAAVAGGGVIGDRFIIEEGVKGSDGSIDPEYNAFIHVITNDTPTEEASDLVLKLENGDIVPLKGLDVNGAKQAFLKTLNNSSIVMFESTTVSGSDVVLTGQDITIVVDHIPVGYALDEASTHSEGSVSQHLEGIDTAIQDIQDALGGAGGSSVSDRLDDLEAFQESAETRLDDLEANSSGAAKLVYREITAQEMTDGFLTITSDIGMQVDLPSVRVYPIGGIELNGREQEGVVALSLGFQFAVEAVTIDDGEPEPTDIRKDMKLYIKEVIGSSDGLADILEQGETIRIAYSSIVFKPV
jgi:hypothetical protein